MGLTEEAGTSMEGAGPRKGEGTNRLDLQQQKFPQPVAADAVPPHEHKHARRISHLMNPLTSCSINPPPHTHTPVSGCCSSSYNKASLEKLA